RGAPQEGESLCVSESALRLQGGQVEDQAFILRGGRLRQGSHQAVGNGLLLRDGEGEGRGGGRLQGDAGAEDFVGRSAARCGGPRRGECGGLGGVGQQDAEGGVGGRVTRGRPADLVERFEALQDLRDVQCEDAGGGGVGAVVHAPRVEEGELLRRRVVADHGV